MSIILSDLIQVIENEAPLYLQESYDNSGLIVGDSSVEVTKAIISLDLTEDVMKETVDNNCNLIITHHPFLFHGIKKLNSDTVAGRLLTSAIKNNIAIYSVHTNIDNAWNGMNKVIAGKLGLVNTVILKQMKGVLRKLVVFCPSEYAEKVRNAIFEAGAGVIGNYDCCSFNVNGKGTFRGNINTNPFAGEAGKFHEEEEIRIETIYPAYIESKLLKSMLASHPYEEVAYDIYPLSNNFSRAGAGITGSFTEEISEAGFLNLLKETFKTPFIKHSGIIERNIKKVAVCGGSGSFLINDAIEAGADALVTGDIKYHEFQQAEKKIIIADVGHYESEQFIKNHLLSVLNKYFPTFAVLLAKACTNSVKYF